MDQRISDRPALKGAMDGDVEAILSLLAILYLNRHRRAGGLPFNPSSEVGAAGDSGQRGAHASGGLFSAARRKPRPTKYFAPAGSETVSNKSEGETPKLARGTRTLPIPISEFGFKHEASRNSDDLVSTEPVNI
jgi:hypothetical protein